MLTLRLVIDGQVAAFWDFHRPDHVPAVGDTFDYDGHVVVIYEHRWRVVSPEGQRWRPTLVLDLMCRPYGKDGE